MQVGNGAEDALDLLLYLRWYIIYWGIVDILPHSKIPGSSVLACPAKGSSVQMDVPAVSLIIYGKCFHIFIEIYVRRFPEWHIGAS